MQPSVTRLRLIANPRSLAPAGGRAQLEAAVWAGADAVYFGLDSGLNACARATSFAVDTLSATMDYLHERGVRGYLTLNTLVFDEELERAEHTGTCRRGTGRRRCVDRAGHRVDASGPANGPGLPIHGSTQMSITDVAGRGVCPPTWRQPRRLRTRTVDR